MLYITRVFVPTRKSHERGTELHADGTDLGLTMCPHGRNVLKASGPRLEQNIDGERAENPADSSLTIGHRTMWKKGRIALPNLYP